MSGHIISVSKFKGIEVIQNMLFDPQIIKLDTSRKIFEKFSNIWR